MKSIFTRDSVLKALPFAFVAFTTACAVPADDQATTTMTADEVRTADHTAVCANSAEGERCHARVLVDEYGAPRANAAPPPSSFSAAQLRSFYGITSSGSTATTVAIVDSNGYPRALTDLQQYRSMMGLPPIVACSTGGHPCLSVESQNCTTSLPAFDLGWAQETALDLDMVSAMCPNCNILLVQGTSASFANLAAAENTAASCLGTGGHPVAISNSYGGGEAGTASFAAAYTHPGIAIVASSGDSAFAGGPQFPASVPGVIAVGGTSIFPGSTPRETVWNGAGSGCSTVYAKPSWQHDTGCATRMIADVSAVADPNTGVLVVAPTSATANGLFVFGGTSVAAPLVSGIIGSIGVGTSPSAIYAHPAGTLFDVTSGTNGPCSGKPAYFCNGVAGYDGPTGLGTPIGPGAL
jgi:subtilase family serine protease